MRFPTELIVRHFLCLSSEKNSLSGGRQREEPEIPGRNSGNQLLGSGTIGRRPWFSFSPSL